MIQLPGTRPKRTLDRLDWSKCEILRLLHLCTHSVPTIIYLQYRTTHHPDKSLGISETYYRFVDVDLVLFSCGGRRFRVHPGSATGFDLLSIPTPSTQHTSGSGDAPIDAQEVSLSEVKHLLKVLLDIVIPRMTNS